VSFSFFKKKRNLQEISNRNNRAKWIAIHLALLLLYRTRDLYYSAKQDITFIYSLPFFCFSQVKSLAVTIALVRRAYLSSNNVIITNNWGVYGLLRILICILSREVQLYRSWLPAWDAVKSSKVNHATIVIALLFQ